MTKKMMDNGNAKNNCRPEQFVIHSVSSADIRDGVRERVIYNLKRRNIYLMTLLWRSCFIKKEGIFYVVQSRYDFLTTI